MSQSQQHLPWPEILETLATARPPTTHPITTRPSLMLPNDTTFPELASGSHGSNGGFKRYTLDGLNPVEVQSQPAGARMTNVQHGRKRSASANPDCTASTAPIAFKKPKTAVTADTQSFPKGHGQHKMSIIKSVRDRLTGPLVSNEEDVASRIKSIEIIFLKQRIARLAKEIQTLQKALEITPKNPQS